MGCNSFYMLNMLVVNLKYKSYIIQPKLAFLKLVTVSSLIFTVHKILSDHIIAYHLTTTGSLLLLENKEIAETSNALICYVALKETFVLQSDEAT